MGYKKKAMSTQYGIPAWRRPYLALALSAALTSIAHGKPVPYNHEGLVPHRIHGHRTDHLVGASAFGEVRVSPAKKQRHHRLAKKRYQNHTVESLNHGNPGKSKEECGRCVTALNKVHIASQEEEHDAEEFESVNEKVDEQTRLVTVKTEICENVTIQNANHHQCQEEVTVIQNEYDLLTKVARSRPIRPACCRRRLPTRRCRIPCRAGLIRTSPMCSPSSR